MNPYPSMYTQTVPQAYLESQRARHHALPSQLTYYPEQSNLQQQQQQNHQTLHPSDVATQYTHPFEVVYDQGPMTYPLSGTTYGGVPENVMHGYPYPRLMPLVGMSDEADTASRPRLTAEQTRELEILYAKNNKPSTQQKQDYAQRFRLTKNRVDNWFQNRRAKSKLQHKAKQAELALANVKQTGSQSVKSESADQFEYQAQPAGTLSSQDTKIDMMSPSTWESANQGPSRQNSGHTEYSQTDEASNQHTVDSTCASPSPISAKTFDYSVYGTLGQLSSEYPPEAFTRRGSTLSDLTSHMNGIQLPPEQLSSHETFSVEPQKGFGDRRAQRPAALVNMRSFSSNGPTLGSPFQSGNARTLRERKTCPNALNGGIQKSYRPSTRQPTLSPGALSQAFNQMTPQILSPTTSPLPMDELEEPLEDDVLSESNGVVFNVNPPSADISWSEHNGGDFAVPPLSASLTGDDGGSPPITPLPGQGSFPTPWTTHDVHATATSTSIPTFTHPYPLMHQEPTCQATESMQHTFWDPASMRNVPIFNTEAGGYVYSNNAGIHGSDGGGQLPSSRGDSLDSNYSMHYNAPYSAYTGSGREEPLKFDFSHQYPANETGQPPYFLPVRRNQQWSFHEYEPTTGA